MPLLSVKQSIVPPDRCFKAKRNRPKFGMCGVEDDVLFHPGHDARNNQYRASTFGIPAVAESSGDFPTSIRPPGMVCFAEHLVACSGGYCDLDKVLVWRKFARMMHQLFKHRRRVVPRGVDYSRSSLVPTPGCAPCASVIPNRKFPLRITNAPSCPIVGQLAYRHTTKPASARLTRLSTASEPAELACARASGERPSSRGCGRERNRRAASTSPP